MGKSLVDVFITEEYRASVKEVLDNALSGNEAANFEFPLFTKDQRRVEVLLNATTRKDVNGSVVGVIGVGQDITKRKEAELEMTRVAQELQSFIDTANAPIFGIDSSGLVNEWNNKAAEITGFPKDEVMGKSLVEVYITEEYRASVKEVLDDALSGREAANFEFPLFTKDQKRVDVLLNATTRRDVNGRVVGVIDPRGAAPSSTSPVTSTPSSNSPAETLSNSAAARRHAAPIGSSASRQPIREVNRSNGPRTCSLVLMRRPSARRETCQGRCTGGASEDVFWAVALPLSGLIVFGRTLPLDGVMSVGRTNDEWDEPCCGRAAIELDQCTQRDRRIDASGKSNRKRPVAGADRGARRAHRITVFRRVPEEQLCRPQDVAINGTVWKLHPEQARLQLIAKQHAECGAHWHLAFCLCTDLCGPRTRLGANLVEIVWNARNRLAKITIRHRDALVASNHCRHRENAPGDAQPVACWISRCERHLCRLAGARNQDAIEAVHR
jgi:PAS domain S-box-containing protein